jgi:hypothetical protein
MNGLAKSFGLLFALCLLILVVAVGLGFVYEPLLKDVAEDEETIRYPTGGQITEKAWEHPIEQKKEFRWLGCSISSKNTISIQIQYIGPTIENFDEKEIDFYINGQQCEWQGQLTKEKSGRVIQLNDGEKIYMLITFECAIGRGDTLTIVYKPLDIEISAQI